MQSSQYPKEQIPPALNFQLNSQPRTVVFLHNPQLVALMNMLDIQIMYLPTLTRIQTIKRLSPPKHMVSVSAKYFLVHYSDNNCILYETHAFTAVYFIIGIFGDHKGIKVSRNSNHLLYANDTAIQMWNVPQARIQLLSHKFRSTCVYALNQDGTEAYLGTYNGEINFVRLAQVSDIKQKELAVTVPFGCLVRVHSKFVLAIEIVDKYRIASVDYGLEVCLTSTISLKPQVLCKIQSPGSTLMKPLIMLSNPTVIVSSELVSSIFLSYNDEYYELSTRGKVKILESNVKKMFSKGKLCLIAKRDEKVWILYADQKMLYAESL